jgi:hypothetical protein
VARLTDRGLTEDEAAAWMERANGSHTLRWTADVFRWVDGEEVAVYDDLPIIGGTLSMDGSDPIRRQATLEVGSGGELVPDDPDDPLAPFGQKIRLWLRIDAADGTWLPRLRMGEFVIVTTTSEWPSLVQTVECSDYSYLADTYLWETKRSWNQRTVREAVEQIIEEAIPDQVFTVNSPGDAHDVKIEPHTNAEAGTSRWETIQAICQARGYDCFFSASGNLIIRHDVTNNSNDVETIPGEGPDIGTVSNPVAVIKDGPGGNLVALTVAVTREGAVNGVFINVHETIAQRVAQRKVAADGPDDTTADPDYDPDWDDVLRGDAPPPEVAEPANPDLDHGDPEVPKIPNPKAGDPRVNVAVKALAVGSIKWGDRFGRQNIVLERNVKRINDNVVNAQIHRAKRLLHRRGGVIRSVDLDAVGLYWLEPDDKVRVKYDGRTEAHYVASIELDLTGADPTRVRTRSINTMDPG